MALRAVQTVWCGSGGLRTVERELERVTFRSSFAAGCEERNKGILRSFTEMWKGGELFPR